MRIVDSSKSPYDSCVRVVQIILQTADYICMFTVINDLARWSLTFPHFFQNNSYTIRFPLLCYARWVSNESFHIFSIAVWLITSVINYFFARQNCVDAMSRMSSKTNVWRNRISRNKRVTLQGCRNLFQVLVLTMTLRMLRKENFLEKNRAVKVFEDPLRTAYYRRKKLNLLIA